MCVRADARRVNESQRETLLVADSYVYTVCIIKEPTRIYSRIYTG